jgi:hypothetical protein
VVSLLAPNTLQSHFRTSIGSKLGQAHSALLEMIDLQVPIMDEQKRQNEREQNVVKSLDSDSRPADTMVASAPDLKSSLGRRMGSAAKIPVLTLISNSDSGSDVSTGQQRESSENLAVGGNAEDVEKAPISWAKSPDPSTQFNAKVFVTTERNPDAIPLRRAPSWFAVIVAAGAALSAGILTGYLARDDNTHALAAQKEVIERATVKITSLEQRISDQEAQAQRRTEEFKLHLEDAEAKRRMDEEDQIARLDDALKKAATFKRLADEAETKLQEAQNEFAKATSFLAPSEGNEIIWPSDPPKAAAASLDPVGQENRSSNQKPNFYRSSKKRPSPQAGEANN